MLEQGRLGTRQLTTLIFMMVVGDMMLIYPSVITSYYGYSVLFFGLLLEFIALPFPGETTMAYAGFLSYKNLIHLTCENHNSRPAR